MNTDATVSKHTDFFFPDDILRLEKTVQLTRSTKEIAAIFFFETTHVPSVGWSIRVINLYDQRFYIVRRERIAITPL